MKKSLVVLALLALFTLSAQADDKRWYKMRVSGPTITNLADGTRELRWIVKTGTRFDVPAGDYVDLDTRPFLKEIVGKPTFRKIKDTFKHKNRKSKGDPKRSFDVRGQYEWQCDIGIDLGDGKFSVEDTDIIYTKTKSKPTAQALKNAVAYRRKTGKDGITYRLSLKSTPATGGVVRYREKIGGFSGMGFFSGMWAHLWHFNTATFKTEIVVRGVPKDA
jgi:hypothetical protein